MALGKVRDLSMLALLSRAVVCAAILFSTQLQAHHFDQRMSRRNGTSTTPPVSTPRATTILHARGTPNAKLQLQNTTGRLKVCNRRRCNQNRAYSGILAVNPFETANSLKNTDETHNGGHPIIRVAT